jgi:hypothetical protein
MKYFFVFLQETLRFVSKLINIFLLICLLKGPGLIEILKTSPKIELFRGPGFVYVSQMQEALVNLYLWKQGTLSMAQH